MKFANIYIKFTFNSKRIINKISPKIKDFVKVLRMKLKAPGGTRKDFLTTRSCS